VAVVLTRRPIAVDGSVLSPLSPLSRSSSFLSAAPSVTSHASRSGGRQERRSFEDEPSSGRIDRGDSHDDGDDDEVSIPRRGEPGGHEAVGKSAASILVVDDEDDLLELVRYNLTKVGYRVACVSTGEEALRQARRQQPDLIVLDLMLPAVDGLEVCRRLKGDSKTREIPIIMLTAKSEESDMVTGLERGADDYITKPFSPRVLVARVKALLRRQDAQRAVELETTIDVHELSIHPGRHEATLAGKPLDLTYTEFALLQFLAKRPGWAYTRSQIVDAVKGEDYPVTERSVDVQVAGLRKKLGRFGSYIETVRGVGYRFRA
jgi:two-component system alkaline phosphatase synthesis response regulator PhoP